MQNVIEELESEEVAAPRLRPEKSPLQHPATPVRVNVVTASRKGERERASRLMKCVFTAPASGGGLQEKFFIVRKISCWQRRRAGLPGGLRR